jgi:hypothetical protein
MEKVIAREVTPENLDLNSYFDDEGYTNEGGDNCAIYMPTRDTFDLNDSEWEVLVHRAQGIVDDFDLDYAVDESLLEWASSADVDNLEDMLSYLSIITGKEWCSEYFTGYVQGAFCDVVYCKSRYSEAEI